MCFSSGNPGAGAASDAQKKADQRSQEQFDWQKKVYEDDIARQLREAELARQQEEERQNRISTGLDKVNKLFAPYDRETGLYIGSNRVFHNNKNGKYFVADESGKRTEITQRKDGQWITADGSAIGKKGADPTRKLGYYDKLGKDYISNYLPGIQKQYSDTKQENLFALARNGNVESSAAATAQSDLERQLGEQKLALKSRATGYENQARSNAEARRNQLVNQVYATADPATVSAAGVKAGERAAGFNSDPAQFIVPAMDYSPLGQLFTTAATIATNTANTAGYSTNGTNGVGTQLQRKTNEGRTVR